MNLSNLKIITKGSPAPTEETTESKIDTRLIKLESTYKKIQAGKINQTTFEKTMMRTYPKLLTKINPDTRIDLNERLNELLSWYMDIKILLIDPKTSILEHSILQKEITKVIKAKNAKQYKEQSLVLKGLLDTLLEDSITDPKFQVSTNLINKLDNTHRSSTFIKEIALCFGLYRKYLSKIAEDLIKDVDLLNERERGLQDSVRPTKPIIFKTIDQVQPRFNLINNHIKNSLRDRNTRKFNMSSIGNEDELNKINKSLTVEQDVSAMGTKKRLNEINKWLNNGLIHTQVSMNKLNNLKIRRTEKNTNKNFGNTIDTNYMIWCLLKDIEAFLASMEDLLMGKSFILGVLTKDNLDVLEVGY